jgi:hypothetical protein
MATFPRAAEFRKSFDGATPAEIKLLSRELSSVPLGAGANGVSVSSQTETALPLRPL